jgi:hypothetical protein
MNCYVSAIIGIGMMIASFSTMSISKKQTDIFKKVLSTTQINIYDKIIHERRNQYFQGLILGLFLSYIISKFIKINDKYFHIVFSLAITVITSVIYYSLMKKKDYMLNHLKTVDENKAWLKIYRKMRHTYLLGFIIGSLSSLPISYALC